MAGTLIQDAAALIAAAVEPLLDLDDAPFAEAFDRFADARVVLLGEASHGTSEFYGHTIRTLATLVSRTWEWSGAS